MKPMTSRLLAATFLACITLSQSTISLQAAEAAAPKPAAKQEKLPAATEIIAKFVKAIGGKDAILKHDTQTVRGTFQMPAQGISGKLEVFASKPNKMVINVQIPSLGDMRTGYDGTVGWSMNNLTGPMVLEGKQLEQIKEQADFASVLHEEKSFKSMETVGIETFDGKECYKLKLVRTTGAETIEYYEIKTGLLIGLVAQQESPLGTITVSSVLSDYKKFGEASYATKTVQSMGPMQQTITIDSIDFGKVPADAFALPEPIKAMVKPQP